MGRRGALPQAVSVSFPALAVGVQQLGCFYLGPRNGRGRAQAALGTNGSEPEASFLAVLSLETWEAVMGCFSSLG